MVNNIQDLKLSKFWQYEFMSESLVRLLICPTVWGTIPHFKYRNFVCLVGHYRQMQLLKAHNRYFISLLLEYHQISVIFQQNQYYGYNVENFWLCIEFW